MECFGIKSNRPLDFSNFRMAHFIFSDIYFNNCNKLKWNCKNETHGRRADFNEAIGIQDGAFEFVIAITSRASVKL